MTVEGSIQKFFLIFLTNIRKIPGFFGFPTASVNPSVAIVSNSLVSEPCG
jgi:hypothetical protein